jgi:adhesin transport system outer membrane protein
LLAAPAALAAPASPTPAAAQEARGSLYPEAAASTALARALGSARHILDGVGPSEEFRAAVRSAIGRHPVFHQEASRRAEARIRARGERAALYPRLSGNLQGDYVIAREFGSATDNVVESLQPDARLNAGLSASQLLFDGGAAFARIKGAKADDRSAKQSLDARINELALSALSAYEDLLVHQAILLVADDFIRRHETLLSDVKERDRLGAGTRADVMQATARLAGARARMAQIRESMRLAEIRYREFFAAEPGRLSRPSFEASAVSSREEAAALAVARHPEVGVAAARADRARADYKAAKAARLPELRAVVNGVKYDVLDGSDDYDLRAGVNLNYDFFAGGARGAAIAAAGEVARQGSFDEERVRLEIGRDAMIAFERRAASGERLSALADAVVANSEARRLVFERFRAARGDLIDVLQAENDYFESALAFLAGVGDRDMTTYALMEHTGDLLVNFSPAPDAAGRAP